MSKFPKSRLDGLQTIVPDSNSEIKLTKAAIRRLTKRDRCGTITTDMNKFNFPRCNKKCSVELRHSMVECRWLQFLNTRSLPTLHVSAVDKV